MDEMNQSFPQMKLFSESLERIQNLGGLPNIMGAIGQQQVTALLSLPIEGHS
jgi:hypothetical protein